MEDDIGQDQTQTQPQTQTQTQITIDQLWTHSWDSRGTLKLLDMLFKQSLTDESPKSIQPFEIKLPLRPHQLAVVAKMITLEKTTLEGVSYGGYKVFGNYGFIGDEVGTGKSLCVLSYISKMKHLDNDLNVKTLLRQNCSHFYVIKEHLVPKTSSTMIVVPHTLFRQWQKYAKDHTTLKCFAVKSRAQLNLDTFKNNVETSDFVLVSNTLYAETMGLSLDQNITWKRIFFDEADSIHITNGSPAPNAGFVWFMSASWANFILHGTVLRSDINNYVSGPNIIQNVDHELRKWLRNEIGTSVHSPAYTLLRMKSANFFKDFENTSVLRGLQVIRCREEFIHSSMVMPEIYNHQVLCEQPPEQRAIHGLVNPQIQAMLHGGDIQSALTSLGVKQDSASSLLEAFTTQQEKELIRLKKTLEFKESMEYATPQAKEAAIASLKTKIASVEEQMKTFKERIDSLATELCPICYDEPSNTTMTPCCHRIFCGACMLTCLTRQPSCPMCRTQISVNSLIHVSETPNKQPKKKETPKLLRKPEALLDYIVKNPTAKVLVFSRYENPFAILSTRCEEAGIQVQVLKGNKDCIANSIHEFESGNKRVLFLHTQTAGAGVNLVGASHVVLYHSMSPEEERQVIGRAYRLGRTDPLHVVRLVHENEQ
jgi:SNF2 family DNA or RNA helicase